MNIIGASGHAKVIIDIVHSRKETINYIFDDNPNIKKVLGYAVSHGNIPDLLYAFPTIVAIGDNKTRKKLVARLNIDIQPFIAHSSAVVSSFSRIMEGTVIMANAVINAEAAIGKHCIINSGAVVEHNCKLADFVHISPNATLAGNVTVGIGAHIGIGATVIPGIKIGKWAVVGAGAVIIEDVPDDAVVVGNPGKIIKINPIV